MPMLFDSVRLQAGTKELASPTRISVFPLACPCIAQAHATFAVLRSPAAILRSWPPSVRDRSGFGSFSVYLARVLIGL